MKRQPYFPTTRDAQPLWFGNFATQLPLVNAVLGQDPAGVTAIVADARYCEAISGAWLTDVRKFGPACTLALDDLYNGTGAGPYVLPVFTPPALPAGVVAVPAGALTRIFAYVAGIKLLTTLTDAISQQLGIVGQESITPNAANASPEFTLKVEQGSGGFKIVRVTFKKAGHKGVAVYGARGNTPEELLGIDMLTPYLDERALLVAGQPEVRTYRLRFYDDDGPTGEYTDPTSVTVGP